MLWVFNSLLHLHWDNVSFTCSRGLRRFLLLFSQALRQILSSTKHEITWLFENSSQGYHSVLSASLGNVIVSLSSTAYLLESRLGMHLKGRNILLKTFNTPLLCQRSFSLSQRQESHLLSFQLFVLCFSLKLHREVSNLFSKTNFQNTSVNYLSLSQLLPGLVFIFLFFQPPNSFFNLLVYIVSS